MSSYVIGYANTNAYYSRSGAVLTGYPAGEAYGNKGSLPRKRPLDLLRNMTGHSASSTVTVFRGTNLPPPIPVNPGMDYPLYGPAQMAGCGAVGANLISLYERERKQADMELRLRKKIKDQVWNAATTSAEFVKTASFVSTTVKELWRYYRLARKGDFLALAELYQKRDATGKYRPPWPARVTNRYLAYRYAVRPLVKDLDDAMHHFYRSGATPTIQRVGTRGTIDAATANFDLWNGNTSFIRQFQRTERWKASRTVYIEQTPDVVAWKKLGLTNLAVVLWELTPYSFLVDRVLPVMKYLASLDAMVGVSVIAGYKAEQSTRKGTVSCLYAFGRTTNKTYSRQVQIEVGLPLPSFSPSPDALLLMDVAALLSRLKDRPPRRGF